MVAIEEQIKAIEDEIAKTKYNKATQGHIGRLKAKLAKLRLESEKRRAKGGGAGKSYAVAKSGDATVGLVGLPSVGKSTLLNALTNAESEVGAYEFTTLSVIPGAMEVQGAQIQVLDLPGLIGGAATGRGRGREVISVVRTVDLVVFVIDPFRPEAIDTLQMELDRAAIRVNTRPKDIRITANERGGIQVASTVELTKLTEDDITSLLREFGISNATVVLRDDATADELIDAVAGNRVYVDAIVALNKCDMADPTQVDKALRGPLKQWRVVPMSAEAGQGLEELRDAIFEALDFIRLYMKPPGKPADMEEPLVIRRGATVQAVCRNLHRDMERKFRYALVWGESAKFPGQTVGLDHTLADGDILSLIVRR